MIGAFDSATACIIDALDVWDTSTIMPRRFISAMISRPSGLMPLFGASLRRLAGVRIRQLVVTVVRERHVAAAAVVELADTREVGADRIAVLDADDRDLAPASRDAGHVGRM